MHKGKKLVLNAYCSLSYSSSSYLAHFAVCCELAANHYPPSTVHLPSASFRLDSKHYETKKAKVGHSKHSADACETRKNMVVAFSVTYQEWRSDGGVRTTWASLYAARSQL